MKSLSALLSCTSLVLCSILVGCDWGDFRPSPFCAREPCPVAEPKPMPPEAARIVYRNSTLRALMPDTVRLTPGRALYNLLEHGNSEDAVTWSVKRRHPTKIRSRKRAYYEGYIEVFPVTTDRGADCRRFTQTLTIYTKTTNTYETEGQACKRLPDPWVIVEEAFVP